MLSPLLNICHSKQCHKSLQLESNLQMLNPSCLSCYLSSKIRVCTYTHLAGNCAQNILRHLLPFWGQLWPPSPSLRIPPPAPFGLVARCDHSCAIVLAAPFLPVRRQKIRNCGPQVRVRQLRAEWRAPPGKVRRFRRRRASLVAAGTMAAFVARCVETHAPVTGFVWDFGRQVGQHAARH